MGNCFRDCYDVYFSSEHHYSEIPDEEDTNIRDGRSEAKSVKSDTSGESLMTKETILPSQLDKYYEIGPVVGIGSTSKVHLAKRKNVHWKDNQQLVCKIINKARIVRGVEDSDIDPLLELLCREVEILKMIRHDNVVKYYDFMQSKDKLFIITERLEGGELFEHILAHGALKEEFANRIMYGVFAAVAYLHERGIVHRDIKAENLLFFKNSDGEDHLKLIDFGFSTLLGSESALSFIGTGGYIAPEIRQRKAYSTAVDNWSLGVLLFCTLSAKLPFSVSLDEIPNSLESCSGAYELVFAPKSWSHMSDDCKDIIMKLLEVDPSRRLTAKQALLHPWVRPILCLHYVSVVVWYGLYCCRSGTVIAAAHITMPFLRLIPIIHVRNYFWCCWSYLFVSNIIASAVPRNAPQDHNQQGSLANRPVQRVSL